MTPKILLLHARLVAILALLYLPLDVSAANGQEGGRLALGSVHLGMSEEDFSKLNIAKKIVLPTLDLDRGYCQPDINYKSVKGGWAKACYVANGHEEKGEGKIYFYFEDALILIRARYTTVRDVSLIQCENNLLDMEKLLEPRFGSFDEPKAINHGDQFWSWRQSEKKVGNDFVRIVFYWNEKIGCNRDLEFISGDLVK